jgi:hypothetical protein
MSEASLRQENFLHTFLKQNNWDDPVLDEPEFAELRSQLAMT